MGLLKEFPTHLSHVYSMLCAGDQAVSGMYLAIHSGDTTS